MSRRIWFYLWILLIVILVSGPLPANAQDSAPLVVVLNADGPIAPAMGEYLSRGLRIAERRGVEALILQLNTPGGSVDSMNDMVQDIRASAIPVVVYIAPRGAMAASAGTMITLAGHVAAMAPETTIGAASPVGSSGEDLGETMEAKEKNILKATIRTLTERRGAEAVALAENTIETAEAVSANEALEVGLVDFISYDLDELLEQLHGFEVETSQGVVKLETANAQVTPLDPSFIEQLLVVLTNPNVVFLLLTIGVQAILIEISSPGGWIAGFIGVVCLALATYGLGVLPVNWFGFVFLIVAFVLFILDIKAPTHGALTAAGVGSLIVGALVLFNSPNVPSFQQVSVPLVVGVSVSSGAIFFGILLFAVRAQRTPHLMGQESLVGRIGVVKGDMTRIGIVQMAGEQWTAELLPGQEPLSDGDRVEVVDMEGLKLHVRKAGQ
jgi:membrane-bound serine protease (ClpP class)